MGTQIGAVAWGIDCGKEVPAVYSSVPYAMCWIDWVMSCVGESDKNVDNLLLTSLTSEDLTTPRQASTGSLERIARHGWMRILSWETVARSSTFQSTRGPQGKMCAQINKF